MCARILIVDNENELESLICQKLKGNNSDRKLEFIFVRDRMTALQKLQSESSIDIAIADIEMTEFDGLSLLEKVNAVNPKAKTIAIAAYSDMEKIRKAMNLGVFDVLNRPIDWQDLENTLDRTLKEVEKIKNKSEPPPEIEKVLQELERTKNQLIQSEKLSVLGQLLAGIAHDINNPVNFIYGNISHADEYIEDLINLVKLYQDQYPDRSSEIQDEEEDIELDFLMEDLPKILSSMKVGVERIRQMVVSLRNFSRTDDTDMKPMDLHEGIDVTLMILNSRLKAKPDHPEIQVIKNYGNLPKVECYFGQINQAFMNLLANAIDAIEEYDRQRSPAEMESNPCRIQIQTETIEPNRARITISDNGPGMPPEVRDRAFNAFFTTKPIGKGTGLGLSISRSIIVEKHHGELNCISAPGEGSTFIIEIPIKS